MGIRLATMGDLSKIHELYLECKKSFSSFSFMEEDEIDISYIKKLLENSIYHGLFMVYEKNGDILAAGRGEYDKYKAVNHVMRDIILFCKPGKESLSVKITLSFFEYIRENMPSISQVKASYRASNKESGNFQRQLGFEVEYISKNEILLSDGSFEDIIYTKKQMKNDYEILFAKSIKIIDTKTHVHTGNQVSEV